MGRSAGETSPFDDADTAPRKARAEPVSTQPVTTGPAHAEAAAGVRFAPAPAPIPPRVSRRTHMWDSPTLTEIHQPPPAYHEVSRRPRRRRWWILAALALVLVGAAAAVVLTRFRSDQSGPAQAVRAYFDDLASGDTASAMQLVDDAGSYSGAANPLLATAALATASDRPGRATITGTAATTDGGSAATAISVSYTIDGTPVRQTIVVVPGPSASAAHPYLLKSPFITVAVSAAKDRPVKVNGIAYPSGAAQALAFPGAYAATVAGNALIAPASARATYDATAGAVKADIWLPTPHIADGATDAVQAAVNHALDACAASTSATPPGCPFRYDDTDASMRWKISKYPKVKVKVSSGGAVTYDDGGHAATVHYDATTSGLFGLFPRTSSGDMGVDVAGTAKATSDGVTVTFGS
jgi:hypothetical protein